MKLTFADQDHSGKTTWAGLKNKKDSQPFDRSFIYTYVKPVAYPATSAAINCEP